MIGSTISHYKIIEKLGEGGMGEVYLAEDIKLERNVAIKFLPRHLTKDKETVERLEREARAAASLNHPNIVTIHEIADADDQTFIVMEYVEGKSLRTVIDGYELGQGKIIDIISQICDGLSKAHQAGIVHRDIKPENIIIDKDARVKILDFGLAKLRGISRQTKETSTLGTLLYMSPEQLQGKDTDQRSDIWSVGVLLYEMLSGKVPFTGDYEQALMYAILNEKPSLLEHVQEKIDINLQKMLAKDPDLRFQNCEEVLEALQKKDARQEIKRTTNRKNILYASGIFVLLIIVIVYLLTIFSNSDSTIKSLAVLPLENLSNDPNQEYFVDGITDVLISELAQLSALKVISRTSVMQYKGQHKSLREIARDLDVDAVVEGTVFSDGNQVRITTQLIRAADDRHLWADKYEYQLQNIFRIQNEVARSIAAAIELQLTDREQNRLATIPDISHEAYQLYLRGRYHWNQRTEESIHKAKEYFIRTIEKDSTYAAAYAGLADCYVVEPAYYMTLPNDCYPRARQAAQKALVIDPHLAEALTSLAAVRSNFDWAWNDAERLYQQALRLNPNYATAHHWYAEMLICVGRHKEALGEIQQALYLDPLSPILHTINADIYRTARDYPRAIEGFLKAIEIHPNFYMNHRLLAYAYSFMDQHQEAIRSAKTALALSENPRNVAILGYIYARAGEQEMARQMLDRMKQLPDQELNKFAADVAILYLGLNNNDESMNWMQIAYEQHDYILNYAKVDPICDPLRSDPRFLKILKQMRLE